MCVCVGVCSFYACVTVGGGGGHLSHVVGVNLGSSPTQRNPVTGL